MRLSSIVSLLVVTASLALGGCAAEAETAGDERNPAVVPLSDKDKVVAPEEQDRLNDARQVGQIADLYENPSDATKARDVGSYKGGAADPRIDVTPSPFGQLPQEKIGAVPPTFRPFNVLENSIELEQGFTPYGNKKP